VKSLNTLVEDIYTICKEGCEIDAKIVDEFGELCKDALRNLVAKHDSKPYLRMSMVGKKPRQVWYKLKGYKGIPIEGHTLIKFAYGHMIEALVLALAELAGHSVTEKQTHGEGDGVKGSIDCLIDGQLLDVKSCSSYAFKDKFTERANLGGDAFGYYGQGAGYEQIVKKPFAGWLAVNKETGGLRISYADRNKLPDIHQLIKDHREYEKLDTPPERCYEPEEFQKGGNLKLSIGCSYCEFMKECWKDANDGKGVRTFIYSGKPVHLVKVVKEPNVVEVT